MSVITVKRTLRRQSTEKRSLTLGSFPELTGDYFASEKRWKFFIEALLFVVILAISAWPILAAADALNNFSGTRRADRRFSLFRLTVRFWFQRESGKPKFGTAGGPQQCGSGNLL
ncbi:MAG: hypothetical protein ABR514_00835 [Chthoniobacterales bacterium]